MPREKDSRKYGGITATQRKRIKQYVDSDLEAAEMATNAVLELEGGNGNGNTVIDGSELAETE